MAVDPIPKKWKDVWDDWNIRGIILLSLSLQTFLILFAPSRKGSGNKLLVMLIWSAYLLADWAANYAVGLISDSQGDNPGPSDPKHNNQLLAFWPTFLLLHLGGPDTITALALEDNELWLRHSLGLITQAASAVYVFLLSLPNNKVLVPSILMFIAGVIKYFERSRALYLGSVDRFRESMLSDADPGPNYAKLMEEYESKIKAQLPARIITIPEAEKKLKVELKKRALTNLDVVHYAHHYFSIFKGLLVDIIYSFRERDDSRNFFRTLHAEDSLKIIEVELNFIYEVFYTKVNVTHSWWGVIFRLTASGSVAAALCYFYFRVKKHEYEGFDVGITYTLFWGAIALDVIAFFMFIFSDWTLAALTRDRDSNSGFRIIKMVKSFFAKILQLFLYLKSPWWQDYHWEEKVTDKSNVKLKHQLLATPPLFRRWSGYVSGHNLIRFCLRRRPEKRHRVKNWFLFASERVLDCLGIGPFLEKMASAIKKFVRSGIEKTIQCLAFPFKWLTQFKCIRKFIKVSVYIWDIVIYYLWIKFILAVGCWILDFVGIKELLDGIIYVSHEPFTKELWQFIFREIETKAQYADDPEAAESISSAKGEWIMQDWDPDGVRIKELLSYVTDVAYDESILLWHIATELLYFEDKKDEHRTSSTTSDDNTIDESTNEALQKEYNDLEFSKLLSDYMMYLLIMQPTMMSAVAGIGKIRFRDTLAEAKRFFKRKVPSDEKKACEQILKVKTYVKPSAVKGDRSKSVLFDGSILAKELKKLEKRDRWELMSKVWLELLSYAATHCDPRAHAQLVSSGGELITFVWLLMAHFGLGEQFKINKGQGRSKLIVGK